MMTLLRKEIRLTASPLSFLFIAFAFMTMIPNYPILLGGFFVCFGIFHSFQSGREAGDILYTVMLPVEKADVVRAKFVFTVFIQLLAFVGMCGLTLLRMTLLPQTQVYADNTLMNANPAYLGYILLIYACFNSLFVRGFFKDAYRLGKPFLAFGVAVFFLIGLAETLHFLPGCAVLNRTDFELAQLIPFAAGLLLYVVLTVWSLRSSIRRFEQLDL